MATQHIRLIYSLQRLGNCRCLYHPKHRPEDKQPVETSISNWIYTGLNTCILSFHYVDEKCKFVLYIKIRLRVLLWKTPFEWCNTKLNLCNLNVSSGLPLSHSICLSPSAQDIYSKMKDSCLNSAIRQRWDIDPLVMNDKSQQSMKPLVIWLLWENCRKRGQKQMDYVHFGNGNCADMFHHWLQ